MGESLEKTIRKITIEFSQPLDSSQALVLISNLISDMQKFCIKLKTLEVNGGNFHR